MTISSQVHGVERSPWHMQVEKEHLPVALLLANVPLEVVQIQVQMNTDRVHKTFRT